MCLMFSCSISSCRLWRRKKCSSSANRWGSNVLFSQRSHLVASYWVCRRPRGSFSGIRLLLLSAKFCMSSSLPSSLPPHYLWDPLSNPPCCTKILKVHRWMEFVTVCFLSLPPKLLVLIINIHPISLPPTLLPPFKPGAPSSHQDEAPCLYLIWTAEDPTQKSSTHVGAWQVSFWALCTLAPGSSTLKKLIPTCWLHFHTTLHRFCVMNCFRVLHSCNPSYPTIVQSSRQLLNQQVLMPKHQSKLQEFSLLSIEQKVTRQLLNWVSSEGYGIGSYILLLDVCSDEISITVW